MKASILNLGKPLQKDQLRAINGASYCTEDCFKTGGTCSDGVCINFDAILQSFS
ncbi:hypothetical protein [Tenacibaculum agarivorans]|uniref:hypothetical protein n=1 Tax=Tenacibaculum agarivorans TaxID=1908389 RepID=UPI000A67CF52|nr:hypothetical protein [Tenacibaculum agarivorans]